MPTAAVSHWATPFLLEPLVLVIPLSQGLQHHNELLRLQDGSLWVAKLFASSTWLGPTHPEQLEFTEELAAVVATRLALTQRALRPHPAGFLIPVGNQVGVLKPYCPGKIHEQSSPHRAACSGRALAALHQLGFKHPKAQPFPAIEVDDASTLSWVCALIDECNQQRNHRDHEWVVSHRDLHSHNLVWQDNKHLCLLDWESAGLIHPLVELLGLALNCAGVVEHRFEASLYTAVLTGYYEHVSHRHKADDTLWHQIFHSWLLWYAYCLKQGKHQEAEAILATVNHLQKLLPSLKAIYTTISET
ncbi:phosphotransferase [Legionella sp. MW5194]|uniref:phosphotransferase enzyme family protein n=1 Tax=Legionella sp. MW5194 TaxID=2662448 RepID=UPI00193C98C3|nr:phosphotransferase [Legionella sp. MW5194]QRN02767.1 phosphotransferase [Legionella sp. MW5194]